MFIIFWKIGLPRFSTCLRSLESALRPGLQKFAKEMSYTRRDGTVDKLSSSKEVCTFDYGHRPSGKTRDEITYDMAYRNILHRDTQPLPYRKPVSVNCGELRAVNDQLFVQIAGRVKHRQIDRFLSLHDSHGSVQLIILDEDSHLRKQFSYIPDDAHIEITGIVKLRPQSTIDKKLCTGEIEVVIRDVKDVFTPKRKLDKVDNGEACDKTTKKAQNIPLNSTDIAQRGGVNSYCCRTHTCGELGEGDVGKHVELYGWLSSVRNKRFVILRDGHGITQCVIPVNHTFREEIAKTPLESVIMVSGLVCARPPEQVANKLSTGKIEVLIQKYKLVNPAKEILPFIIREHNRPKEDLRMKYRYLDLRFEDMQYKLRMRSKVLMKMREFLINHKGFVEVETPTLFKRTPGGAQEYVVPTRIEGKFYSLVQSPQQLKQLLMIGSMDRYFQVARCYRDEGARPDRQPEFTQVDIELSFTDRENILSLIEDLLKASFPEFKLVTPFPIIKYKEAMHWYGTDKPDIRFNKKLVDISDLIEVKDLLPENVRDTKDFTAKVLVFDSSCDKAKLKHAIRDCEDIQKLNGDNKSKLIVVNCSEKWKEAIEESLPFLTAEKLKSKIEFPIPSTIVVGVGKENEILPLMSRLRLEMFQKSSTDLKFAWIVDFPLFLEKDDGTLESAHHPFTQANEEDVHLLDSDPLKVRGLHFDLVLNGYEVGGGSIRIHNSEMQTKILKDFLKIPTDSLEHLLEALESGAPPHGGIALGIDRLLSIMVGADSIREVIAFPKGVDGKDPLSGAPCPISDEEKQVYHLIPRSPKSSK